MDHIKEAFQKVKEDVDSIKKEFSSFQSDIQTIKESLTLFHSILNRLNSSLFSEIEDSSFFKQNLSFELNQIKQELDKIRAETDLCREFLKNREFQIPTEKFKNPTQEGANPTNQQAINPQNTKILDFSTGNVGVPTDRQTNQQTDRQEVKDSHNNQITDIPIILNSLDSLKKELRIKCKRLTDQELAVLSLIYQLEETYQEVDYRLLAQNLSLSESSIRDYVGKIIKKGIPIIKNKVNNKSICLFVDKNFKQIASLSTIIQLRDL